MADVRVRRGDDGSERTVIRVAMAPIEPPGKPPPRLGPVVRALAIPSVIALFAVFMFGSGSQPGMEAPEAPRAPTTTLAASAAPQPPLPGASEAFRPVPQAEPPVIPRRCVMAEIATDVIVQPEKEGTSRIAATVANVGDEPCRVDDMFQISVRQLGSMLAVPGGVGRERLGLFSLLPGNEILIEGIWQGSCGTATDLRVHVSLPRLGNEVVGVDGSRCVPQQTGLAGPLQITRPSRPVPTECADPVERAVIGAIVGFAHGSGPGALASTLGGSPGFNGRMFGALADLGLSDFFVYAAGNRVVEYGHIDDDLTVSIRARQHGRWGIDLIIVNECP